MPDASLVSGEGSAVLVADCQSQPVRCPCCEMAALLSGIAWLLIALQGAVSSWLVSYVSSRAASAAVCLAIAHWARLGVSKACMTAVHHDSGGLDD